MTPVVVVVVVVVVVAMALDRAQALAMALDRAHWRWVGRGVSDHAGAAQAGRDHSIQTDNASARRWLRARHRNTHVDEVKGACWRSVSN